MAIADEKGVLRSLSLIAQAINSGIRLEQVLKLITIEAVSLVGADAASVMLLDDTNTQLVFSETCGLVPEEVATVTFKVGEGVAGWVALHGRPAVVDDVSKDPRWVEKGASVRSILAVPLKAGDRVLGVVSLTHRTRAAAFGESEKDLAILLASHIATNIEKYRLYELSIRDPLTGAHNYRFFQHVLDREFKRARRYKGELAVIMLDIDHFKRFNDTWGHQVGDEVLRSLADAVRTNVRDVDLLARYGGEEFAIILPSTEPTGAMDIAERICNFVEDSDLGNSGRELKVTVSIGVAAYSPKTRQKEELLRRADMALYQAKREGRNRVVYL